MNKQHSQVSSAAALLAAAADVGVRHITVTESLADVPTLRLSPGQTLTGADPQTTLRFAAGQHGLQLSTDNSVDNLELVTDIDKWAVFNDTGVEQLGRLLLQNLVVHGVVLLLARDKVRGGHVEAHDVDIVAADARGYDVRPAGFGVEVIPGAFTLWNQQPDKAVTITAELTGLSAGRAGAPVHGSGIFVSGAGDVGGRMVVSLLETGAVYSHGGIAPGVANRISGGVFTVYGAFVDSVHNLGPVTTYGQNDMVLDNWGSVDSWVAEDKITSYGPSGIGFAGTVHSAEFDRVVTHADGAVGMQISQPVGSIVVHRGIETFGGTGDSLVKGVVVQLSAIALSFKPGAWAREVSIAGGLTTHGPGVNPLELHGTVDALTITGGINAAGEGF